MLYALYNYIIDYILTETYMFKDCLQYNNNLAQLNYV